MFLQMYKNIKSESVLKISQAFYTDTYQKKYIRRGLTKQIFIHKLC